MALQKWLTSRSLLLNALSSNAHRDDAWSLRLTVKKLQVYLTTGYEFIPHRRGESAYNGAVLVGHRAWSLRARSLGQSQVKVRIYFPHSASF